MDIEYTTDNGISHSMIIDFEYEGEDMFFRSHVLGNINTDLIGKWMATSGCENLNGERNWFLFNADGKGQSFAADCNNTCEGYGVKFNFEWTSDDSEINVRWTSVYDYCGVSSEAPSPETLTYSLSGNTLRINGKSYTKQ